MNTFINIKKDFSPNENFWELNPHLIYVKPFSYLYNRDESENKIVSSKEMWCILWMSEPDEEVNKYYRLPVPDRLEVCNEYNPEFNIEDEEITECIAAYPEVCLSSIERAYKMEKDQLVKRAEFLSTVEYSLADLRDLDYAKGMTYKIYKDFDRIEQEYFASKRTESRIYGGRKASPRERGLIQPTHE